MVRVQVRTIFVSLLVLSSVLLPTSFGKLTQCLELKSAKIDKVFRQEFLIRRIYFPIGQNLQFGQKREDAVDEPSEFPPMKSGERPKCFTIHFKSELGGGQSGISNFPFNCIRNEESEIFCHLNTRVSNSSSGSGHFPLSLWGTATVVKTDNRNYMLVVSCNSNQRPSWVLMHRSDTISKDLRQETLDYVEDLGFERTDTFESDHPQQISLLFMDFQHKCPMNVWPPQI